MKRKHYFFIVCLAIFALWACERPATQQNASTTNPSSSDANSTAVAVDTQSVPLPENPSTTTGTIVTQEQGLLHGAYAVLYGNFGSEKEAEDNSRVLRAQRINCYIHKNQDQNFGVLIGPFRDHLEASKQMSRLQSRGIESLSLYHLGEQQ